MPNDTFSNVNDILLEVQSNLYESNLRWYTQQDILDSIQDQYNKIVAMTAPIEHSTFIPMLAEPYYDLKQIPNFMYLVGIYNPYSNLWLEGLTYKQMKATYQTYLAIGLHKWVNIVDFTRVILWPYDPSATGVLYVLYKASAPPVSLEHIPQLPNASGPKVLEFMTTADLFEQAREFKKAQRWWDRTFKPEKGLTKSIYQQMVSEIEDLARTDRERVLEPYRWIFHGGQFLADHWIDNEIPSGTINGVNATFYLAQVPNPTASLLLTKNGQILYEGQGYSLNGQTITFNGGYIPQVVGEIPDTLRAWYRVN